MSRRRIARAAADGSFWAVTPAQTATRPKTRSTFPRVIPPMQNHGTPSRFAAARYERPSGRRSGFIGVANIGPTEI